MNPWKTLAGSVVRVPRLATAACKGEEWMADLTADNLAELVSRAESVCRSCDSRQQCAQWVDRLEPHDRPSGYVGGQLLGLPPAPPRRVLDPAADAVWLTGFLAANGPTDANRVMAAGRDADIPAARLRAARKRVALLRWDGPGRAVWSLPDDSEVAS